tara:strand:- start:1778 stop:2419 length:642 start_codon:yes stop_codon:yes gene_type:complete
MSTLQVNTISESTSASGVTIDGVLIKDGLVDGKDVSTLGTSSSDGGFQHIDTTTFTSAATWTKTNVFSATYNIYRIYLTVSETNYANHQSWFQLAASGTTVTTGYVGKRYYEEITGNTLTHATTSTSNGFYIADPGSGQEEMFLGDITVSYPYASLNTIYKSDSTGTYATGRYRQQSFGYLNNTTSYDGYTINFNSNGNQNSGTVSVYGLATS